MAKAKSTSGSKPSRTNVNQEPTSNVSPANVAPVTTDVTPAVKAVAAEATPVNVKPEVKVTPEPRKKLEVVKSEPRRVVPINVEEEIRRRAYELYQQRGAGSGDPAADWLIAEQEVQQRYHQQQQHSA
jgi:hypothetical protein